MSSDPNGDANVSGPPKRPLPALGLPKGREDRRGGAVLSILAHVLVIGLLIAPVAVHHEIVEREQGAGGPGPAGGGGGGRRGTGGELNQPREKLRYIVVTPQPVPTPTTVPEPRPVVTPPVIPPPKPIEQPKLEPQKPVPEVKTDVPPVKASPDVSLVPGSGGGTGNDGSMGSGPGSGGGVGSGVGTGRGSGVGSGTGGGRQENYPPTPIEVFIPPLPVPDRARGFHLIAEFDVDETGRVLGFDFTPTRDGDYNRKLRDVFKSFRFRPGTRPDGTPLRMKAQIGIDLP